MHVTEPDRAARLAAQLPVTYLAFDVLVLDRLLLLEAAYAERRSVLTGLGLPGPWWQVPPAFTRHRGADVLAASREHGLEGVVAKRLDSRYEPGLRSAAWRKIKNVRRQEVVVGGWKRGEGGRSGRVGSLLIGVHGRGLTGAAPGLQYAGHVGTGFTEGTLATLGRMLAPLRRDTAPFASPVPTEHARDVVWVEPRLVAEVEFAGWTSAGRMRAASFKGLRDDIEPEDVTEEWQAWTDERVRVDGRQLEVSNLEKVLFPEVSFTKAQVIDYYRPDRPRACCRTCPAGRSPSPAGPTASRGRRSSRRTAPATPPTGCAG